MEFHKLSIDDKEIFEQFFMRTPQVLCAHNFAYIYIWSNIYSVEWVILKERLCVFFKDNLGVFLIIPPVGKPDVALTGHIFDILDKLNTNSDICRIENADSDQAAIYKSFGYDAAEKFSEYVCKTEDLSLLRGGRLKSKRAGVNFFTKNNNYLYQPYNPADKEECLKLYDSWSAERSANSNDQVYVGMLEDSKKAFVVLLDNLDNLGIVARVVRVGGEIKGFTCGYELNPNTFVVLYEVTDLSIKGLAQFIFMKFCQDLSRYAYINIMDDSGLGNLAKTKLSYRPVKLEPSFIIKR